MVEIAKEPPGLGRPENCFYCGSPSLYWAVRKDVCCCMLCASQLKEEDVPEKKDWVYGRYKMKTSYKLK